ncbi:MAG: hypothetical protein ACR2G0_05910 [Chthoniobacterales bacterium]
MSKYARALFVVLLGLSPWVVAQGSDSRDTPLTDRVTLAGERGLANAAVSERASSLRSLRSAWVGPEPISLTDSRAFSFPSVFGWVQATPADSLPAFTPNPSMPVTSVAARSQTKEPAATDLLPKFDYFGGEVGAFYGRSTGGSKREVEAGYIIGEIVDGNTHIRVGASYERSTGRGPRLAP